MAVRRTLMAFNRGILSVLGLARVDIEKLQMAAERMVNWMPRVLGSMMLRPGTRYLGSSKGDAAARGVPFVFGVDDYAMIEVTDGAMRVWVNDELITRPAVSAAVANGDFDTDVSSWTDADESGATSSWLTGGYLSLLGDGTNAAIRRQQVTVTETGTVHALEIVIARGPVRLKVGSASGTDDYISETLLGTGEHSLAFTPTGNFHIELSSTLSYSVLVDSINVEGSGAMEIVAPFTATDLRKIRHAQSGDVIYVSYKAGQQRKIERRGTESWSIVTYEPQTGPFRLQNTSNITITASALSGDVTLTASSSIFKSTHVGALFRVASSGQLVLQDISAEDTYTNTIRVVGVGAQRQFGIQVYGTFTATVTLQQSVGSPGSWVDLANYTAYTSTSYNDALDNQVVYYRLGIKTGGYTSGTATCSLSYAAGSISGVARITGYTSGTSVSASVFSPFGGITASNDWWEGEWSDFRGYPSGVALFEGRLWWGGKDKIWGSISDAYEDFDDEYEGDAGPISRSIGEGPVDAINWLMPLGRLLFGTAFNSSDVQPGKIDGNNILAGRSSSFDEPLTPTNFNLKSSSARGVFVDRSGERLFELLYDVQVNDYTPTELTLLVPELNDAGIVHVAVQTKPDVRIHCVRSDGTSGILIYDRAENVICWVEKETVGQIEDVVVLPGVGEDQVYELVFRENGRFWEKWALEADCDGRPVAHLADSHVLYSGAEATVLTGLSHLEGQPVVVWGWNTVTPFTDNNDEAIGRDLGTYTVASGQITVTDAVTDACIGLAYGAEYKSVKLGTMNANKRIGKFGVVLRNTHYKGLRYGPTFTKTYDLAARQNFGPVTAHHIWDSLESDMNAAGGIWEPDTRLCLTATAPRPVTVLAATVELEGG